MVSMGPRISVPGCGDRLTRRDALLQLDQIVIVRVGDSSVWLADDGYRTEECVLLRTRPVGVGEHVITDAGRPRDLLG